MGNKWPFKGLRESKRIWLWICHILTLHNNGSSPQSNRKFHVGVAFSLGTSAHICALFPSLSSLPLCFSLSVSLPVPLSVSGQILFTLYALEWSILLPQAPEHWDYLGSQLPSWLDSLLCDRIHPSQRGHLLPLFTLPPRCKNPQVLRLCCPGLLADCPSPPGNLALLRNCFRRKQILGYKPAKPTIHCWVRPPVPHRGQSFFMGSVAIVSGIV